MRIPSKARSEKAARTRKRNANPLLAAKKLAERPQPAVKVFRSGREVCNLKTEGGRIEYRHRIEIMRLRQGGFCFTCGKYLDMDAATFDHEEGRGMGGGHRDDRIWKDGRMPYNRALCMTCNTSKGSKRGYENSGVRTERTGRFTI